MTNEDIAYSAGLFDGEGCIGVYKSDRTRTISPEYGIKTTLGNTDESIIDWLISIWNGKKYFIKRENQLYNCKPFYNWNLAQNDDVLFFLNSIKPYSKIKLKQIELALEYKKTFISHRGNGGYIVPAEELFKREQFYIQMKALNKRGA